MLQNLKSKALSVMVGALLIGTAQAATADELSDRINAGEPIRLGFATAIPWAYPGDNGEPLGFVNAIALVVLEEMGITNYETSVNEWAGLIPGLQANRYDIITGGMYILKSRCENMNFSDPIGLFGDAMLVPAGNPKGIHNYQDVISTGAKLVTGAGFNTVEAAKKEGVPEDQMMLVAGEVEILAAMNAGRADVAVQTFFGAKEHVDKSNGKFEVTNPADMPEWTKNWVGIGMRHSDTDFLAAFNEAMAKVVGGEAWMANTAEYGYTEFQLPGEDASTEFACANR
ncbi:transporter substrate-binding domain-containing protein [uncultured Boseongicola sp.]|jgi:polar amino acid transport system substrate-binding protein|uniref:transporter substrate-binding domain-containing protein n=1 Tax=uncultured Boseongicola sp. TaxID=1648499 RepID=UPI002604EB91|nr:transporter substrate-binding domain-containing protein [uncultured Boseongicola sp.]